MTTYLIAIGIIGTNLGIFYELLRLCSDLGVPAWCAGLLLVGVFARCLWRECKGALYVR